MHRETVDFAAASHTADGQKLVAGRMFRRFNEPARTARRADDGRIAVPNEADIVL
jgi:hypothetical protein